jgi:hypothetical protein
MCLLPTDLEFKDPVPSFPADSQVRKSNAYMHPFYAFKLMLSVQQGLVSVYAGARVVTDVAVAGTMCGLLYARQSTTAS